MPKDGLHLLNKKIYTGGLQKFDLEVESRGLNYRTVTSEDPSLTSLHSQ